MVTTVYYRKQEFQIRMRLMVVAARMHIPVLFIGGGTLKNEYMCRVLVDRIGTLLDESLFGWGQKHDIIVIQSHFTNECTTFFKFLESF